MFIALVSGVEASISGGAFLVECLLESRLSSSLSCHLGQVELAFIRSSSRSFRDALALSKRFIVCGTVIEYVGFLLEVFLGEIHGLIYKDLIWGSFCG